MRIMRKGIGGPELRYVTLGLQVLCEHFEQELFGVAIANVRLAMNYRLSVHGVKLSERRMAMICVAAFGCMTTCLTRTFSGTPVGTMCIGICVTEAVLVLGVPTGIALTEP